MISDGLNKIILVFKLCSENNDPLVHLKDVPAFSVGYSHYPPALVYSLVYKIKFTYLIDLHIFIIFFFFIYLFFFLQIHYEKSI